MRVAWRTLVAGKLDAKRFVFVDEMGANTSVSPIYGWARRGHRAYFRAPRNWGANVTLLSSMTREGMGPSLAVEGPTTREVFEAYVDRVLAPELLPGQIVVMDNPSAHKGSRIRKLIEERGCEFYVTCRPTPPISTPSKGPSARSKGCCAVRRLVAGRLSLRRWAKRSLRSVATMPGVSLSIAATA